MSIIKFSNTSDFTNPTEDVLYNSNGIRYFSNEFPCSPYPNPSDKTSKHVSQESSKYYKTQVTALLK